MPISAFDLDHTLIEGNSSAGFCRYLCKQKVLPFSILFYPLIYSLRHRFFGMSLSDLHHSVFNRVLRGKPLELMEAYADKFVGEYVNNALYIPAIARLKRAQQLGHYTMILSNGPSFLVKRFAKVLGVNAYKGTEYSVDAQKRFKGIKSILDGKDKANYLRKMAEKLNVFLEEITTYSDSIHDLEFLELANAIAVNPDRQLLKISMKKQWRII